MHPVVVLFEHLPAEGKTVTAGYAKGEVNGFLADAGVPGVAAAADVTAEMRLLPSGRDLFVLGGLRGRMSYDCVRCLESFERDVEGEFQWVGVRECAPESGEVELHRQDLDLEVLDTGSLDLTRLVEEQLLLALEPHPVCREACRGLCSRCGENLDRGECRCEAAPVDPRFAVLAALRAKKGAEG